MILCAAIRLRKETENRDIIIPCHRHINGYELLRDLTGDYHLYDVEEGFIDHQNRFLDRKEAFLHWMECGQSSAEDRDRKRKREEDELYSEDLY